MRNFAKSMVTAVSFTFKGELFQGRHWFSTLVKEILARSFHQNEPKVSHFRELLAVLMPGLVLDLRCARH